MNILPCNISIEISHLDGQYQKNFVIPAHLNAVVYDLRPGSYNLQAKTSGNCPKPFDNKISQMQITTQEAVVSGFVVRLLTEELDIIAMREPEDPRKLDDAAPRFRYFL